MRASRSLIALVCVSAALASSACTGPAPDAPGSEGTLGGHSEAVPTGSASDLVTPTGSPAAEIGCPEASDVAGLAESWKLVIASKGAEDHSDYVDLFTEKTSTLAEAAAGGPSCEAADEIQSLNREAAEIVFSLEEDEGLHGDYTETAAAGDALVAAMGMDEEASHFPADLSDF